ncbi:MAG: sulfite exporter TauE/SafE family protein [Candidatus Bathyarchaeota archaeon]|nr:MAG: sulfite exporter TauE/SafE family protein [Candidatus Bathyarchaeota archaeon]
MEGTFLIYVIVGLSIGFVDSSLGMGYGVTATSVLVTFGIAPAVASASIHTSEGFVDIISAISHWKFRNIETNMLLPLVLPGVIGAALGATLLSWISTEIAKPLIGFILLSMGLLILVRHIKKNTRNQTRKIPPKLIPLLGFFAAFIDVTGGGGWGPICTPTFIINGTEPRKAVGTVEATEPFISLTAMIVFGILIGFETFLWNIVIPILIGGILLTPVAAWITNRVPKKALGILIGFWVTFLSVRMILKFIGVPIL